jgi:hypothetical protein
LSQLIVIDAMTDAEILELIARLLRGEGNDAEADAWMEQLERATRCPNISDLIFYGDPADTPEAILQKARQYRPIQL